MIVRYILPNIAAALIVMTSVCLSTAILTEASLSYLGLSDDLRDVLDPRLRNL